MNKLAIIRVKRNGKVQIFYTQSREEIEMYRDLADENCEVIIKVLDLASLFFEDDFKAGNNA